MGAQGEESFEIFLNDSHFVNKWVSEFQWCLDNCKINQQEAFAGLVSLENSVPNLIKSCETINQYIKNFIEIRNDVLSQPQDYFNYLHLKFEELSGEFGKPTRLFSIAPDNLKNAIRNLNFFVHRLEKKQDCQQLLYFSFDKDCYRRFRLSEDDYANFQFELEPGTLCLHYAELGKNFNDLYKDKLPIDYGNFKNLHFYSGEASLLFCKYQTFQDSNYETWIRSHGYDPYNKTLGHGKIPLGIIGDPEAVYSKIQKYQFINEIIIKE